MDISPAALPPIHGTYSPADEQHPRFREYRDYRNWCSRTLIRCESFANWLSSKERQEESDRWGDHPEYPAFLAWMRATRAGARACRPTPDRPRGLSFPENFKVWLTGERW
jgi:hypothetical protein